MTPKNKEKNKEEEKLLINISTNLRNTRNATKMSQEELAELADISVDTISNIERRKFLPSLLTLVKLCNALNVTPNDILRDTLYNKDNTRKNTDYK